VSQPAEQFAERFTDSLLEQRGPEVRARYLDTPQAGLYFPVGADVPESLTHLDLRTLLYQLLKDYLGPEVTVGSDQFVYFDAADPIRALAPDVYVQLQKQTLPVKSWKVWERGAPEVAVEILSESDSEELPWSKKLERYRSLGITELVRFDPEMSGAGALRVWHRVNDQLLERQIESLPVPSLVLNLSWAVAEAEGYPNALRFVVGPEKQLFPTRIEAQQVEAQRATVEAQRADSEALAREAAEVRVRELEALLRASKS
jgi:Uma2 family endonuclease